MLTLQTTNFLHADFLTQSNERGIGSSFFLFLYCMIVGVHYVHPMIHGSSCRDNRYFIRLHFIKRRGRGIHFSRYPQLGTAPHEKKKNCCILHYSAHQTSFCVCAREGGTYSSSAMVGGFGRGPFLGSLLPVGTRVPVCEYKYTCVDVNETRRCKLGFTVHTHTHAHTHTHTSLCHTYHRGPEIA
jgi:hypothetical protein